MKIEEKGIAIFILLIVLLALLNGCKSKTVYVPIETIKTEYNERLEKDSIYLHDSVFVDRWRSNDTIFITKEKYKYLYRDKLIHDTIAKVDSIRVPYPVVETKVINELKAWQIILMCLGGVLIVYVVFRVIR